jgi:hypothetical protein
LTTNQKVGSSNLSGHAKYRSIAQLGSAPALGAGGRGFESRCSDQCNSSLHASPSRSGGIGRRTRLKIVRETVPVRVRPPGPCGGIAQLGEHLPCKQGVVGSNPSTSTMFLDSSAVEHPTVNRRVVGSNPTRGANVAPIAQLVECIHGKDEVTSSSLVGSSRIGPMVKRLRHRPFTAVTRVRIPLGSPFVFSTNVLT